MKTLKNSFVLTAIAVLGIVSCNEASLTPDLVPEEGKLVTVHFGTENTDPSTKATLTPNEGETAFQAAWENEDKIAIQYTYVVSKITETAPGTWDASASKFSATLTDLTTGDEVLEMKYQASYPYSEDGSVDFGSVRTQTGAAYNSIYDLMVAEPVTVTAKPGLDELGNAIVFPMQRQTAIAYFHFTSDNTEAITKATLKVEGEGAAIAAETVILQPSGMVYDTGLSEIVLTVSGQTADDFTLWFNVLPTSFTKLTLTVETATKTFEISNSNAGSYVAGKLYKVKKDGIAWTDKAVTDVITAEKLAATSTSYTDFSEVKISSNAVYAGNSAKTSGGAIQLRSDNSDSGIISTTSGGKVTKVSVEWASNTTNGRVINVYGNTNPYTAASNLYSTTGNTNQGTKIGTIVKGTSTELVIDGNYPYIGIRSNSGALYLNSVSITWEPGSSEPAPDTYTVSCATVTGGTLSADPSKASAGTEVTLTATPNVGYQFNNNNWTVTNDETSEQVTVEDGKFTMPAANVTVSASFSKVDYTITKTESDRGSFVAKKGDAEVETAQMGDEITLVATPNEGYELKSWTVVDSEETAVVVDGNKFTMPASNVTVSATFNSTASYTVSFSVNGTVTTESYKESEKIVFPTDPEISGVTFMGWTTSAIVGTQAEVPVFVETSSAVMGTENITYYAVFASQGTEKVSETIGQTLAYDTWTYEGSTTNKSSYRLFHSGSYIESASFDLSTLTKVVVYGGTFGGDNNNKLTIGDGTNTWKVVTVSGNSQTGTNTYTDGTPLTGTGKLRITSNSGTASSTGVRISKVEIYVGVYAYTDYCTNVVTLTSVAISGAPTKTEYVVGDAFEPAGLTVTGTYSDGSNAAITEGINWTCSPATFTEAGSQTVSVTATVKSVASAAYDVNVTVNKSQLLPPANLKCTAQTETSLTFTWDAVAKASGYQVSTDGGNTYGSTQYETSYTWTGLTAGTTKTLYVKAIGNQTAYTDSNPAYAEGTTSAGSGSGEKVSYVIMFKTGSNSNSTIDSKTAASTVVSSDSEQYITSFTSSCSKAYYATTNGVKLGSNSAAGTLEFNLADAVKSNVVSIKVETAKYGSDTGTITMYNGSTELKSDIDPAVGYTHEFTSPTTVESLKFVTSSKRAYISKITITVSK